MININVKFVYKIFKIIIYIFVVNVYIYHVIHALIDINNNN